MDLLLHPTAVIIGDEEHLAQMDFVLTQHATDAVGKRGIKADWLEQAFYAPESCEPDPIDPDLEQRFIRIPERGGRVLRLVVNVAVDPNRIVTVFIEHRRQIT